MDAINNIPIQLRTYALPIAAVLAACLGFVLMFGGFSSGAASMAKGGFPYVIVGAIIVFVGGTVAVSFLRGIGLNG